MAVTYTALPAMGPLVGSSFDRALTVMLREWRVLAIVAAVGIALSFINFAIGEFIGAGLLVYWYYHSLANAVRLVEPGYAMKSDQVLRLIGINFVYGLAVEVGFLLLIVPGIYIANKWSLASLIAVRENTGAFDALNRSWAITDAFFWPTLWFNIVSGLGVIGLGIVGYIIMAGVWFAMLGGNVQNAPDAWQGGGIRGMALAAGMLIYFLAIAYTYQAKDIAMLNWYNALKHALSPASTAF